MKYLKYFIENIVIQDQYSIDNNDPILLELKDILSELETNDNKFSISIFRIEKNQYFISITLEYNLCHEGDIKSFEYDEVSEVVERIKDYISELGDYTFRIGDVYQHLQERETQRFYLEIRIRENVFK